MDSIKINRLERRVKALENALHETDTRYRAVVKDLQENLEEQERMFEVTIERLKDRIARLEKNSG